MESRLSRRTLRSRLRGCKLIRGGLSLGLAHLLSLALGELVEPLLFRRLPLLSLYHSPLLRPPILFRLTLSECGEPLLFGGFLLELEFELVDDGLLLFAQLAHRRLGEQRGRHRKLRLLQRGPLERRRVRVRYSHGIGHRSRAEECGNASGRAHRHLAHHLRPRQARLRRVATRDARGRAHHRQTEQLHGPWRSTIEEKNIAITEI